MMFSKHLFKKGSFTLQKSSIEKWLVAVTTMHYLVPRFHAGPLAGMESPTPPKANP